MRAVKFERLRAMRVSPQKRGADLAATTRGPLTGLVPGATLIDAPFVTRGLRRAAVRVSDVALERRGLHAAAVTAADPRFERRALRGVAIAADDAALERRALRVVATAAADPLFEARRLRPGAPIGATIAAAIETRWPTVAGTPFEFTPLRAGRFRVLAADRLRTGESMTREEQLALNGAFITIEGQRREITAVRPNDDGSCDLTVRPPIALAAPVEVFEPLDVKGSATVTADTTVRFVPAPPPAKND